MRKFFKIYLVISLCICAVILMCACNPSSKNPVDNDSQKYVVSFILNGSEYSSATSDQNGKISLPDEPDVGPNFVFEGWFLDKDVWNNPFTVDSVISDNLTVYAKVSRKEYKVSFMVNDNLYQSVTSDQNGKISLPDDPDVGQNFVFEGWFLDKDVWNIPFDENTTITENVTVYAKVSRKEYKVSFILNGSEYSSATSDQNGKITLPDEPDVGPNFVFEGWFLDNETWNTPFKIDSVISENTTVYAKVSRIEYKVSFILNGSEYSSATSDQNGKISLPDDPDVGQNFVFEGWFLDKDVWNNPFTVDSVISENLTVYAKVSRKEFKVSFMVNDNLYQSVTSDQNGKISLPDDPDVGQNFVFEGWFLDKDVWNNPFDENTTITENVTVYAKVSRKEFKVSFMVNDNLYQSVTSDQNGKISLPDDPDVGQNFVFEGWFLDKDVWNNPFTVDSVISENTTVYAKVSRKEYKVTFMVNDNLYQSVTSDQGGKITLPDDPDVGQNFVFEGWFLDNNTWNNPFDENTTITEDTIVYAKMFAKYILDLTNGGTVETLNIGSRVWNTNDYVFTSLPKAFLNKPYILWSINGTNKATVIKSGWVYVITGEAVNFGTAESQMERLDGYNFTLLDTQFWNLWTGAIKNNFIYEKYVEPGETFELGRWSVVIMSDNKLDLYEDEPIPADKELAVLKPTGNDSIVNMALSAKVFSDRNYTFYDMPFWLAGKNYIQSGYASKSHSATVTKSGLVYMFTSKAGNISQVNKLVSEGWSDVTDSIPSDLNIFGDSSQNGAFLNSTYKGFALLKKQFNAGDTITWEQWGIPVFSGEITVSDDIAKLVSVTDSTHPAKAENGMRLFSDRTYYAMNGIPSGLEGLTYFIDGIETGATVKAVTSGTAYLMIPSGTKAYKTLETEVVAAGWKLVPSRPFRPAVGLLFGNRLYYKQVAVNEEIHFGKYNLIFGAPLDNEDDYYVMPSISTPADIILNPEGDFYDTNKQNWLGCPTVEKTAGGRVWSGWFTGGQKELGTGNYAIIGYSDDNCNSWKKAVAVVHPNTAVQVTKPELWTAPNGDLWLFWIQHTSTGNFDGRMGTWVSVCKNPDAESPEWSAPRRLTDGYMRSKPIIVNVNGTVTWMYTAFDWMQPHYTRVYASTDKGQIWSLRGKAECIDYSSGKNNLDDPVLVQKPDGTLWLLMRPSDSNNVYESFSTDGGYTWTHARKSDIRGPQSRFTIDLLDDGTMLMVFHDSTERARLTAYLSDDGGKTWKYKLLLDERGGVSYPDTIITSDGTVYVIYDRNRTTDREIYMTVFTLKDIIAGKYVSENSRQKILVDKTVPA